MTNREARLSDSQLGQLRAALERAVAKLERSMKSSRRAARPVKLDQTTVGRLSRVDAMQNQSLTKGLQARQHFQAAQLADALERMDNGTYVVCTGCGEPIQFERLDLFPETSTCSRCAS
jgi:DnaK suppressor protein